MQKRIFTIESNEAVARDTFRVVLRTDGPVAIRSGQFVDIAIPGFYLRRPISVSDTLPDGVVLYYKVVGEGTAVMARMVPGDTLELLCGGGFGEAGATSVAATECQQDAKHRSNGVADRNEVQVAFPLHRGMSRQRQGVWGTDGIRGLGHGFHPEKCREAALLIGGGLGAAPLYLLARELLAAGRKVTAVLGFNRADEICLADAYRAIGVPVHIATLDGSAGVKGFVTDAIAAARPAFDRFYTCGPLPMMKAVCTMLDAPGEASMEERMGCGAGFCYGCTLQTKSGPRRVCADGPVFDKEEILW